MLPRDDGHRPDERSGTESGEDGLRIGRTRPSDAPGRRSSTNRTKRNEAWGRRPTGRPTETEHCRGREVFGPHEQSGAPWRVDGHRPLPRNGAMPSEAGLRVGGTKRGTVEWGRSSAGRTWRSEAEHGWFWTAGPEQLQPREDGHSVVQPKRSTDEGGRSACRPNDHDGASWRADGHRLLPRRGATPSEAGLRVGGTKRGTTERGRSSAGRSRSDCTGACRRSITVRPGGRSRRRRHRRAGQAAGERCGRVGMAATSCRQVRFGKRVRFGGCRNRFGSCRRGSKVARVHMRGIIAGAARPLPIGRVEPSARVSIYEGAGRCRRPGGRSACRPNERSTVSRKCRQGATRAFATGQAIGRPQDPQGSRGRPAEQPRARDGISGPELLAPERTGSTSDRQGFPGMEAARLRTATGDGALRSNCATTS
jgi:hypothetical protein